MLKALTVVALLSAAACGGASSSPPAQTPPATTTSASVPTDPIAQMEIAFEGNPSKREIKASLDRALTATHTPATNENYSRAGSVLVTFKNQNGTKEMDILSCIPHRANDSRITEHTFPDVAAVCNVDLTQGNYP